MRGTFELLPGSPARLLDDQPQLSGDVPDPEAAGAIRYALDLVPVKPFVDIVLTGSAHTPGERPTTVLPITLRRRPVEQDPVRGRGPRDETRAARRLDQRSRAVSDDASVLGRSFGGQKIELNPRWARPRRNPHENGMTSVLLPNILRQEELQLDPQALHEPAVSAPIPQDWPRSMNKARRTPTTTAWLEERWPAPPSDFDSSFFNAAPAD